MPLPQPHKFSQRIKATKRPGVGDGQTKFEKRGKQYRGIETLCQTMHLHL